MVRLCRNRWKPDTCTCDLEFEFDADLDGASRTHRIVNVYNACPAHTNLSSYISQTLEGTVVPFHQENQRKNYSLDEMATRLGLANDENRWTNLQQYLSRWYFDTASPRVLHIVTKGLTSTQKSQIQTAVNTRFGAGKIVVE